jgi:6-pyruvoyltetrahydropterin/6-carboxytetrahydropterin synthase
MYEVAVCDSFAATHRLRGDFGPATEPHGHVYQVEAAARGPKLGPDGTLADVGLLRRLLAEALRPLRGRDLDTLAVFQHQNTTAEVVARALFTELRGRLARAQGARRVTALRVTVWESPTVSASFDGPVRAPTRD